MEVRHSARLQSRVSVVVLAGTLCEARTGVRAFFVAAENVIAKRG